MVYKKGNEDAAGKEQGSARQDAGSVGMKKPRKAGKGRGRAKWIILPLLLVLGVAAGVLFVLGGGPEVIATGFGKKSGPPPERFAINGTMEAVYLSALPAGEITEESLRAYFAAAVAGAQADGLNTLIYEAKHGINVAWRDKIFPVYTNVSVTDKLLFKLDPLALLMEEAEGSGVQVWLAVDAYGATGYNEKAKGSATKLAKKQGAPALEEFSPASNEYNTLLVDSLAALPDSYGVAGILFSNLDDRLVARDDAWHDAFAGVARSLRSAWQTAGHETEIALWYSHGGEAESLRAGRTLTADGTASFALVRFDVASESLISTVQEWADIPLALQTYGSGDTLALFTASTGGSVRGVLVANAAEATALRSAYSTAEGTVFTGFAIPQTLAVNYPNNGARISTEGLYIMGTSDPAQPLLLDGVEVSTRGENGAFGVLVTLQTGENSFTFTQGSESAALTVTRPAPSGGGTSGERPSDSTREAQPGQAVRVRNQIASALSDPGNDGSMNETFYAGAVAVVAESVRTTRYSASLGTHYTYAYRLTSGDYLLASAVEWISGSGYSNFSDLGTFADDKGEWILFEGSATPAGYVSYLTTDGGRSLILTFYDTSITIPDGFTSTLVKSASVSDNGVGGTQLILDLEPIWGYSLEYREGTTCLYLKKVPTLTGDAAQPLAGIHIVVDPGHGDTDMGAPGVMGDSSGGPNEKDVNLALAQTIAYRLRQMGATVTMTRDDDSFPTLNDRLQIQTDLKPDLFVSVHHNSVELTRDLENVMGSQGYYYHPYPTPASKALAQNILTKVVEATGRGGETAGWGYFYVTRTTICPAVLMEYGFMVNPMEFEDITSIEGIYAAALATADGILQTLEEYRG